MISQPLLTALRVIILASLIAIPCYSVTIPSRNQHPCDTSIVHPLIRRQNGNSDAAGDLYGLGLRLGAYLQIIGMLLSCIPSRRRSRIGVKLLSASVCIALLTAWTILVYNQNISPCEAWLILSLTYAYGAPRAAAIDDSGKNVGGIAVFFCMISVIWQQIAFAWFFATVYRTLPMLGTYNRVWIFAPVDVSGWFRILMLVVSCLRLLKLPFDIVSYFNTLSAKFIAWAKGFVGDGEWDERDEWHRLLGGDRPFALELERGKLPSKWDGLMDATADAFVVVKSSEKFQKLVEFQDRIILRLIGIKEYPPTSETSRNRLTTFGVNWRRVQVAWGLSLLALTIAGIEKIIDYNDLLPQNNLSRPGQIIPFILGIITLIEGAATASMPAPHTDSNNPPNSPQMSLLQLAREHGFAPTTLMNDRSLLDALVRGRSPSGADHGP